MIYSAAGLPVITITGDIKANKATIKVYSGPKYGFEVFERTVNELKADNGWPEIKEAIINPSSYCPSEESCIEFFNEYCK